jgi:hypothetical protein
VLVVQEEVHMLEVVLGMGQERELVLEGEIVPPWQVHQFGL